MMMRRFFFPLWCCIVIPEIALIFFFRESPPLTLPTSPKLIFGFAVNVSFLFFRFQFLKNSSPLKPIETIHSIRYVRF